MAQTYKQLQKQIEQLQRQADVLRNNEIKGVVDRIKVAIAHYGLTAAHLGLDSVSAGAKAARASISKASKGPKSSKSRAAFGDGSGNVWSGRGPRPRWLREALAAGRSLEEFRVGTAVGAAVPGVSASTKAAKPAKKSKRAPSKVTYSDDAGHSWTGRGPKPGWLKAALEAGKSLQDFVK